MAEHGDRFSTRPAQPPGSAPGNDVPSFGEQLRHFRRVAGLTQAQLAERAGLSVAGISALERGAKLSPQRATVRLLVEALALTPDDQGRLTAAVAVRRAPNAGRPPTVPVLGFPPQTDALIGRERELAELATILSDPACRLVTLTGPGGIGKTRLGLQAALDARQGFVDGVAFVPLAPLRSANLLAPAIADTLALRLHGQHDPATQLLDALHERTVLLVLDNFEHLLEGTAFVAELLTRAPAVRLIITSRERLNLRAEWVVAVEGLSLPVADEDGAIDSSGAVRLFVQSARRAQRRCALESADRPHIARICRLVAGMPLAIELAAAWLPVLTCAEIAHEMAGNLDFLAAAPRDAPERHQNMRAVFDHSWRLLAEHERAAFRALTVFRGGFQRRAAEVVADIPLVTLSALVHSSFLRRTPSGRYEIHELLRQYGDEQLRAVPGATQQARDRHCAYYVAFLMQHEEHLRGREQPAALAAIDAELENVRAAWQWATEAGNAAAITRATEGLWLYYTERGRVWEGEAAFAQAVAALETTASAAAPTVTRQVALGMALARQGGYQFRLGNYARARAILDRGVALFRRLAIPRELGFTLNFLAATVHLEGDYAAERRLLEESIALLRVAGDRWCAAYSLNDLGLLTHRLGNTAAARRLAGESLGIFQEFGDRRGLAFALTTLGELAAHAGAYAEAERLHRESLALRRAIGDQWGIAYSLNQLGITARLAGAGHTAKDRFLEALRAARESHAVPVVLDVLVELATLHAEAGQAEWARALLTTALTHPAITEQTRGTGERLRARLANRPPPAGLAPALVATPILKEIVERLLQTETVP